MINFKKLVEKRNELVEKMDGLFKKAETEVRALNSEEIAEFDKLAAEIRSIDETLAKAKEVRKVDVPAESKQAEDKAELESRAFAEYIRKGKIEEVRADINWTVGNNGAVIPTSIANKIIETVENICPIYSLCTSYNVMGKLNFPKYDESTQRITCTYATEFTALESTAGKFTTVELGGYLAGALSKISKSLVNNSQFDIVAYVVMKISEAIAKFLEKELLLGDGATGHMQGVITGAVAVPAQVVTAASATAITADELIKVQMKVPQQFQANTCWIMNNDTLLAVRLLKDNQGRYLLQDDITRGFGYTLLGKHVYVSDNMEAMTTGKRPIVYGDMSGLYTNWHENIEMQLLMEKYADEHAIGAIAWFEADSKLLEVQKVSVLKMA